MGSPRDPLGSPLVRFAALGSESSAAFLSVPTTTSVSFYVAFMSRGAAACCWKSLESKGNRLQHVQHEQR